MTHYCDFEPGDYPESQFELIRGQLYRHTGVEPGHTDDGALYPPVPGDGPDVIHVDADESGDDAV